ncbi:hypothetical protein PIB30_029357 [Stylosanthes scabra]|uniref:Uncharacterized protein n=1 Tax=Stylosanthes scabra TaxID=79078 RepID=A0ABU6SAY2_9FABA|nr:hypothetical protein [Stylosanthes scabra]
MPRCRHHLFFFFFFRVNLRGSDSTTIVSSSSYRATIAINTASRATLVAVTRRFRCHRSVSLGRRRRSISIYLLPIRSPPCSSSSRRRCSERQLYHSTSKDGNKGLINATTYYEVSSYTKFSEARGQGNGRGTRGRGCNGRTRHFVDTCYHKHGFSPHYKWNNDLKAVNYISTNDGIQNVSGQKLEGSNALDLLFSKETGQAIIDLIQHHSGNPAQNINLVNEVQEPPAAFNFECRSHNGAATPCLGRPHSLNANFVAKQRLVARARRLGRAAVRSTQIFI